MKRMVISLFRLIRNRIKWFLKLSSSSSITNEPQILKIGKAKCVALIPHADDELIGLGTLLSRNNNIKLIYFEFLGSNQADENRVIRYIEFKQYCEKTGINFFLFDDEAKQEIMNADVIILPSLVDWHDEHREINYILRDVLSSNCKSKIIWYNISVFCSFMEHAKFVVEGRGDLRRKYKLFADIYLSQMHLPRLRFMIKERIYGKSICEYAAEKFYSLDFDQWSQIVAEFNEIVSKEEINCLKENINEFDVIDSISSNIYNRIFKYCSIKE